MEARSSQEFRAYRPWRVRARGWYRTFSPHMPWLVHAGSGSRRWKDTQLTYQTWQSTMAGTVRSGTGCGAFRPFQHPHGELSSCVKGPGPEADDQDVIKGMELSAPTCRGLTSWGHPQTTRGPGSQQVYVNIKGDDHLGRAEDIQAWGLSVQTRELEDANKGKTMQDDARRAIP